jgi:hypothetical protein
LWSAGVVDWKSTIVGDLLAFLFLNVFATIVPGSPRTTNAAPELLP